MINPPGPADAPPTPSKETMARVGALVGRFGLLLLAAFVTSSLRLPFSVAAIGFATWGVVVGVQAILAVHRAKIRTPLLPALVLGVGLTGLMVVSFLFSSLLWPLEAARQECLDAALTQAARERCEEEFAEGLTSWVERIVPRQVGNLTNNG